MGHTDVAFASYLRIAGLGDGAITVARVEALLSPAHWEVWRLNAVVLHRGQGSGIARSSSAMSDIAGRLGLRRARSHRASAQRGAAM